MCSLLEMFWFLVVTDFLVPKLYTAAARPSELSMSSWCLASMSMLMSSKLYLPVEMRWLNLLPRPAFERDLFDMLLPLNEMAVLLLLLPFPLVLLAPPLLLVAPREALLWFAIWCYETRSWEPWRMLWPPLPSMTWILVESSCEGYLRWTEPLWVAFLLFCAPGPACAAALAELEPVAAVSD